MTRSLTRSASLFLAALPLTVLLQGSHCGPAPVEPSDPADAACTLSCPLGQKTDSSGAAYCECRTDECTGEPPVPYVNPATGMCTGFSRACDVPTGWDFCAPCSAAECGAMPDLPQRTCADGTKAGAFSCARSEDGVCSYTVLTCPEDGEQCNHAFCGPGCGCCNWSCSQCAPAGGVCTQQACSAVE